MAVADLVFQTISAEPIYDPYQIEAGVSVDILIKNMGTEALTDLGIYVIPATTIGDVDNPSDFPPETDYQDLIRWGEQTVANIEPSGGLKFRVPQTDTSLLNTYLTRTVGVNPATKIPLTDLAANETATVRIQFETPSGVTARRMYVGIAVE